MKLIYLFICLIVVAGCQEIPPHHIEKYQQWAHYGGTPDMVHYSSLNQIDTSNVSQLRPAWTYHTGDADTLNNSQIQCNPLVIGHTLYGVSPKMKLFALHAVTGKHKWTFDPFAPSDYDDNRILYHILINNRGLAFWSNGEKDQRLFFTAGSYTYAINAITGKPIKSFGKEGFIDLHEGLDRDIKGLFVVNTSPGIVHENTLILGTRVDEATPAAPGHIRGYDVITGQRKWIFHTIPQPGEIGYESWENKNAWKYAGGANVWSGFSLDEKTGTVFCGTGSASFDFYGGKRKGKNLFANCILALDAQTGIRKWHYQTIHHDIWDKDLPTPPVLVTLEQDGKSIEAVAQATKNGMLFILDRETGTPLFDINEISVDTSIRLIGEQVHPTQPIPSLPKPFVRQSITINDINPYLPDSSKEIVKEMMMAASYGNPFIPLGIKPTIVFPGLDGGAEWGGPAVDPTTGIMYVNANEMPWYLEMLPNTSEESFPETNLMAGIRLYKKYCRSCHAENLTGTGNNPSLISTPDNYTPDGFVTLVRRGRRMMPAFNYLKTEEINAISSYILNLKKEQTKPYSPPVLSAEELDQQEQNHSPFKLKGYTKFLSPEGEPAISPPWGTLSAIDLNNGNALWTLPLGEYDDYKAKGIPTTGTENYGGPVVTAGGLVFIAATVDKKIRAFNKRNGALLWSHDLPTSGFATPAVYAYKGTQFLVIACGGGKLGAPSGDSYVAFALPRQ